MNKENGFENRVFTNPLGLSNSQVLDATHPALPWKKIAGITTAGAIIVSQFGCGSENEVKNDGIQRALQGYSGIFQTFGEIAKRKIDPLSAMPKIEKTPIPGTFRESQEVYNSNR